jgi:CBS domain-containing protein
MKIQDIKVMMQRDLFRGEVRDIMTSRPVCGSPDATLREIARKMLEANCGEIPICADDMLLGVVTDRDITCRAIAKGRDPMTTTARQIMTKPPATIEADAKIKEAIELMENLRVRRLPVVDEEGRIVGILSMTDIALHLPHRKSGELLREISRRGRRTPATV